MPLQPPPLYDQVLLEYYDIIVILTTLFSYEMHAWKGFIYLVVQQLNSTDVTIAFDYIETIFKNMDYFCPILRNTLFEITTYLKPFWSLKLIDSQKLKNNKYLGTHRQKLKARWLPSVVCCWGRCRPTLSTITTTTITQSRRRRSINLENILGISLPGK